MLLAEGQGVIAHYAGRTGPAKIDLFFPGSAYQQIVSTDGWWIAPVVVHQDDLTLIPEDDEQRHRAAVALRQIGERAGFDWERVIALAVAAVGEKAPEDMTLAELAVAQQAVRDESRRLNDRSGRRVA